MLRRFLVPLLATTLVASLPAQQGPAEKIDAAMNAKIRTEENDRSKLMWIEHMLTDVYGPRPIGSPNHKMAADWAVKTMAEWGMKNTHLEPFEWPGMGWLPGKAYGYLLTPVKANLKFEAKPWAPGIKGGTIAGDVVRIVAPVNPTEAELTKYLAEMAPKVRGGIVMSAPPPNVPVNFNPTATRNTDARMLQMFQGIPDTTSGGRGGRGGGGGAGAGGRGGRGGAGAVTPPAAGQLTAQQVNARITALLRDNMPGLLLTPQGGGRIPGEIVAQNGANQIYNNTTPQPPAIIMRTDDYNRIWRIIEEGMPAKVEFHMENEYFPEGKTSYVTVGEIPGTDKADEVVMMGGHLDSWTSATGATDNAIGCAIMLEAARILQTLGVKPRRTIRVALWSGEEEGEYGSEAYVAQHFGNAANPKPDWNKLVAYWNIDEGTGKVRGATILGPTPAAAVMSQIFKPFEDLGVFGALASNYYTSSSDNDAFVGAGLPGIGPVQDGIEYNSTTWHSNLDTYERIIPEDVKINAIITASLMYHLANRDEMLPRFTPAEAIAARSQGRGGADGRGAGVANGGRGGAANGGAPVLTAAAHVYAMTASTPLKKTLIEAPTAGRGGAAAQAPLKATIGKVKPSHGKVVLAADGNFTYTPTSGYTGIDSFSYTVSRDTTTSEEAVVSVVITKPAPVGVKKPH